MGTVLEDLRDGPKDPRVPTSVGKQRTNPTKTNVYSGLTLFSVGLEEIGHRVPRQLMS